MFNTKSKKARLQLEATCSFLAERYSGNAYVTNWVVGNEVNAYQDWNYAGLKNIQEYARAYAEEYRLVATCMKSMYQNARVYISLDNNWTRTTTGVYAGKKFLNLFAQELEKEGKIGFHIAYHPFCTVSRKLKRCINICIFSSNSPTPSKFSMRPPAGCAKITSPKTGIPVLT